MSTRVKLISSRDGDALPLEERINAFLREPIGKGERSWGVGGKDTWLTYPQAIFVSLNPLPGGVVAAIIYREGRHE